MALTKRLKNGWQVTRQGERGLSSTA